MAKLRVSSGSNSIVFISAVLAFGASHLAQAADQSSGCGLGWSIAPRQSLLSSSTRNPINITFSNTSGMTSGTSGCAKHSIVQNEVKAMHFAEANHGQLMIEMAQGQGEHLRGFAAVLGCSGSDRFGTVTQGAYSRIFSSPATTPAQVLDGVKSVIQSDPALAVQCGLTG
jgi:hypothetical protein